MKNNVDFLIMLNQFKYEAKKILENQKFKEIDHFVFRLKTILNRLVFITKDDFIEQKLIQLEQLKPEARISFISYIFYYLIFLKFNNQLLGKWHKSGKFKAYLYKISLILDSIIFHIKKNNKTTYK